MKPSNSVKSGKFIVVSLPQNLIFQFLYLCNPMPYP